MYIRPVTDQTAIQTLPHLPRGGVMNIQHRFEQQLQQLLSALTAQVDGHPQLNRTQQLPGGQLQKQGSVGLEAFPYGSLSSTQTTLLGPPNEEYAKKTEILAYVPTTKAAGEIKKAGIANVFNPEWQAQLADAVSRNGGLGNAQDGYLAWSKYGFVRLKNSNLTDEQNRKIAEMTLQTGTHLEDTPARADEPVTKENVNNWVNTFIERHDKELADFIADPSDGYAVSDGKRKYNMEFNKDAGRVVSYYFKKSGGLRGFVQKHMKYIAPVLDVVSTVGAFIPGVGTAVAVGAQALKTLTSVVATGKLKASQLLSTVAGFIPGGSGIGSLVSRGLNVAADVVSSGKLTASSLFSAVTGLVGGKIPTALKQLGSFAAQAYDRGKISVRDMLSYGLQMLSSSRQGDSRSVK